MCLLVLVFASSSVIGQQDTSVLQPNSTVMLQNQSLVGTLQVIVGDPPPGAFRPAEYRFYLGEDNGTVSELSLSPKLIAIQGGFARWAGKRVIVRATQTDQILNSEKPKKLLGVSAITLVDSQSETGSLENQQINEINQIGSKPWITLLCKFADIQGEPDRADFYQHMYDNSPGGLDHYWRESSYESINLNDSTTLITWVELPGTLDSYMNYDSGKSDPDLSLLFEDCTNAADEFVDFTNEGVGFFGINLMFNGSFGCCAWGGGMTKALDSVDNKRYGVTWNPPWAHSQDVIAHEMGHSFGLPHSNNWDDDRNPYDNPWDVMSKTYGTGNNSLPIYGYLSPHTNAYHKNELGWINDEGILEVNLGTTVSTTLDSMAQSSTSNHRMAIIQVNETFFYTVEARKRTGTYETSLPDDAVIIYEVNLSGRDEPSWAVDSALPPADFGDNEGTMWRVGETYINFTGGVIVTVDAETAQGFEVTIENREIHVSESQKTALIELYNSTDGDNWNDKTNWMEGDPCDNSWFGVRCGAGIVQKLELFENNLNGMIPAELGNLTNLQELRLDNNQLSGPIPFQLGNLTSLQLLRLDSNQLSGPIPTQLGNLTNLKYLILNTNKLSSPIPIQLGNLTNLLTLWLDNNQLNGQLPTQLGNLTSLRELHLDSNQLIGPIPFTLTNLHDLVFLKLNWNALYASDAGLRNFLDYRAENDWSSTQTIAPKNVLITSFSENTINLTWDAIEYTDDEGRYTALYSTSSGGPYVSGGATVNKSITSLTVNGLVPETTYYLVVQSETDIHSFNQNSLVSKYSDEVSTRTLPSDIVFENGFE